MSPDVVMTAAHCVDPESQFSAGLRPLVYVSATNVNGRNEDGTEVWIAPKRRLSFIILFFHHSDIV